MGKGYGSILLCIHSRSHGCEKVGVLRQDGMFIIQLQSTDKGLTQFRKKMERAAKESYMSTDRLSAGKTGNGLVYHCLKNGSRKIFFGSTFINQRLDVCFCKNTASGSDRIKGFVIPGIFIQACSICLQKGSHLINKGSCTSCTDPVHTLFNIAAFKINDLGILAAKLNGNVCLRRDLLKSSGNCNDLLDEWNLQMVGKCQTAGTSDHRMESQLSKLVISLL